MTKARDLANASTALSAVSATELAFVDGVTSAIQTQIDAKAPSSTAVTLTGTQTLTNKTLTSPVLTTPTISTVNAKGDLLAGTADNTVDRLAVGSDGETLVADSSTSTGLRYQSAYNGNAVIGGGFDNWQRGTSFSLNAGVNTAIADRWNYQQNGSTATVSRQNVGDTTNLPTIQYCGRFQRNAGQTSTSPNYLSTSLETSMSIPFSGQAVTVSFYARAGANFSSTSNILTAILQNGTGTDQNLFAYTGSNTVVQQNKTLTTTWQRFSMTATVPANSTELAVYFTYNPTGTAGAADYYEVTGVQLELGSVATTFKRAGGTIQGELAACQRYYWRQTNNAENQSYGSGACISSTNTRIHVTNPVQMRVVPTTVDYSNLAIYDGSVITAATLVAFNAQGTTSGLFQVVVASGLTQFRPALLIGNNASNYFGLGAEL